MIISLLIVRAENMSLPAGTIAQLYIRTLVIKIYTGIEFFSVIHSDYILEWEKLGSCGEMGTGELECQPRDH